MKLGFQSSPVMPLNKVWTAHQVGDSSGYLGGAARYHLGKGGDQGSTSVHPNSDVQVCCLCTSLSQGWKELVWMRGWQKTPNSQSTQCFPLHSSACPLISSPAPSHPSLRECHHPLTLVGLHLCLQAKGATVREPENVGGLKMEGQCDSGWSAGCSQGASIPVLRVPALGPPAQICWLLEARKLPELQGSRSLARIGLT
jgi:hypothetical protein